MSQVALKIAAEIQNQGAIPFARFMELALYCPVYGYYEKEGDTIGRHGDYFTSVSVGSLFGELLAFQFAQWLEWGPGQVSSEPVDLPGEGPRPARASGGPPTPAHPTLHLVEAGAHRGELARDILAWLREHRPALFPNLEYWILEPSPQRRRWQRERLAEFGPQVRWAVSWAELAGHLRSPLHGIVFSNELLDAFPVHRFVWDAAQRQWFEYGVTLAGEAFAWTRMPVDQSVVHSLAAVGPGQGSGRGLTDALPDGLVIETSPAAIQWWREAAQLLSSGKLLTLDYGFTVEERLLSGRAESTLRSYYRHGVQASVLDHPGEQDLTAHVDFSALRAAGEDCGLRTEALVSQGQFLTPIAAQTWERPAEFGEWTPARKRQFQTLTHPDHLGRAFRVLVQSRPVG